MSFNDELNRLRYRVDQLYREIEDLTVESQIQLDISASDSLVGSVFSISGTNGIILSSSSDTNSLIISGSTIRVSGSNNIINQNTIFLTGANGIILTSSNNTLIISQSSGGGGGALTYFTESKTTASPNATVPVISLIVNSSETDIDAALIAKGTGATIAQIPNSLSSGGNKRGSYATDWQKYRSNANQVASGQWAVIGGGYSNRAVGNESVIGGGQNNWTNAADSTIGGGGGNTTSAQYATIAGGNNNNASALYAAIAGGVSNGAAGAYSSIAGGYSNEVKALGAYGSVGGGYDNTNDSAYGTIPGGRGAFTFNQMGKFSYSSYSNLVDNFCQTGIITTRAVTTNTTPTDLTVNGSSVTLGQQNTNNANVLTLYNNYSSYRIRADVVARASNGETKGWLFDCIGYVSGTNGLGYPNFYLESISSTNYGSGLSSAIAVLTQSAISLNIGVTPGTVDGCGVFIQATGLASRKIYWGATFYTTEVMAQTP